MPAQPSAAEQVAADKVRLIALQMQHTRLSMANEAMTMAETSAKLGKMARNAMSGGSSGGGSGTDSVDGGATSTIGISGGISDDVGGSASAQADVYAPQDPGGDATDDPWAAYSGGSTADVYASPSADIYAPAADVTASPADALYFPPAPSYADYAAQSVSADPYAAGIDPSSLPVADASQYDIYVPSATDGYGVYDDSAFQPAGLDSFDYDASVQAAAVSSGGGAEYCPGDTRADEVRSCAQRSNALL